MIRNKMSTQAATIPVKYAFMIGCNDDTSTLSPLVLWQRQSQAWIKEEGDVNHLCDATVSLNSNLTTTMAAPLRQI